MSLQSRPMRRPAAKPAKQIEYTPRARPAAVAVSDGQARMVVPVPKHPAVRSQAMREAYRAIPCQFQWPHMANICGAEDGTVGCCHANWAAYGKGMARKADDSRAASGCSCCHYELDQGKTYSGEQKRAAFDAAYARSTALLVDLGLWPEEVSIPGAKEFQ